jgi:hypothetical protein
MPESIVVLTGTVPAGMAGARLGTATGRGTALPSPRRGRASMAQGPWFYCLKHHTVETRDGCAERHRLGPYETREEAEHALQSVADREQQLQAEDRKWDGD